MAEPTLVPKRATAATSQSSESTDPRSAGPVSPDDTLDRTFKARDELRKRLTDPRARDAVEAAVGAHLLEADNTEYSQRLQALRWAEADAPRSGKSSEARARQLCEQAAFVLRGRASLVADRLEAVTQLIDSGYIDRTRLEELRQNEKYAPQPYKDALIELRTLASLSAFAMRAPLADMARDLGSVRYARDSLSGATHVRFEEARTRQSGVVDTDRYLRPGSDDGRGLGAGQADASWQQSYRSLRQAQSELARRFPSPEDFFRIDSRSGMSTVFSLVQSHGALEMQAATEREPARRSRANQNLAQNEFEIGFRADAVAAKYRQLGRLIDDGSVRVSDLAALRERDPREFLARIDHLQRILEQSPETMKTQVRLPPPSTRTVSAGESRQQYSPAPPARPPFERGESQIVNEQQAGASARRVVVYAGAEVDITLPAYDREPRPRARTHGPNPDLECARLVSVAKQAHRELLIASIDSSGKNRIDSIARIERRLRIDLSGSDSSDAYPGLTKQAVEKLFRGKPGAVDVEAVSSEAERFTQRRIEAERSLSGSKLSERLISLRNESAQRISSAMEERLKEILPGTGVSASEVAGMLFSDRMIGDAVKRAEQRSLTEIRPAPPVSSVPVGAPQRTPPRVAPEAPAAPQPVVATPSRNDSQPLLSTAATPSAAAPLTIQTAQPLAVLHTEGVTALHVRLNNGDFIKYDPALGRELDAYGRARGDDALATAGIQITSTRRQDGSYDLAITCKYPAELRFTARRADHDVAISSFRPASQGGSPLPWVKGEYFCRVGNGVTEEQNRAKIVEAKQLGSGVWQKNMNSAVVLPDGRKLEYFFSNEHQRLYARTPDGHRSFAYEPDKNIWHELPAAAMQAVR